MTVTFKGKNPIILLRKHTVQSLFEYFHKGIIKYIVVQALAVMFVFVIFFMLICCFKGTCRRELVTDSTNCGLRT